MNGLGRIVVASTAVFVSLPHSTQPVHAQVCTPLEVVGANTTTVEKAVSPPSTGITRDNWHTDFAVYSDQSFSRYVANIVPINGGEYTVQMNLKYSDNTADTVFEQVTRLPEGETFTVTGTPRISDGPYQVNLRVGGIPVIGNSYRVSVLGCR